jgi:plastocyanin
VITVSAVALLAMTAACGGPGGTASAPTSPMPGMPTTAPTAGAGHDSNSQRPVAGDSVSIANFAFVPANLTIKVGTTVSWTNHDQEAHDVTATSGAFRSPALNAGDHFTFTFTTPGQYGYVCTIHPFMTATVVVTP